MPKGYLTSFLFHFALRMNINTKNNHHAKVGKILFRISQNARDISQFIHKFSFSNSKSPIALFQIASDVYWTTNVEISRKGLVLFFENK